MVNQFRIGALLKLPSISPSTDCSGYPFVRHEQKIAVQSGKQLQKNNIKFKLYYFLNIAKLQTFIPYSNCQPPTKNTKYK
jgi:hypothetical protein